MGHTGTTRHESVRSLERPLSRALVSRTLRFASVRSAGTRSATLAVSDTSRRMRLRGRAFARLPLVRSSDASQQADGRAMITPFRRGYPVKRRALCSGPPWERGGPDRRMTAWQTIERGVFIIGSFLLSSFSIVWPLVYGGGDWEMSWCASRFRLPLMGRLRVLVFFFLLDSEKRCMGSVQQGGGTAVRCLTFFISGRHCA